MSVQVDIASLQIAPAARISISQLYKVNWALVFRTPGACFQVVSRLVNLEERAGQKNGIHARVLETNETI
jgi:hypothetical protein